MTTEFEARVYETVKRVPKGKVTTYGDIRRLVDCHSARAVGQALKKNPFAPQIPCHRVVASDLSLGGFRGQMKGKELREKKAMLESEGVVFVGGKVADTSFLWRPGEVN